VFAMGVVLYELLALEPLFIEDITQLAIDEVAVHPIPNIRHKLPGMPAELERVIRAALEKDPSKRPSAAQMGRELDRWCETQRVPGSPDMLQEHLAKLFPTSYQPSRDSGERTNFSNLKKSAKRLTVRKSSSAPRRSGLLGRLFGL
jgi:serine/threonine protein kinase